MIDRADFALSGSVRICRSGSRATTSRPLQRHGLADRRVDTASDPAGVPLGLSTKISPSDRDCTYERHLSLEKDSLEPRAIERLESGEP